MKIIEGLKLQKELVRKIEDLQKKISQFSAYSSLERPKYSDQQDPDNPATQTKQIQAWVQSINDLVKMLASIRMQIQYTNLVLFVTIEIGGKQVTKSIAEWVHWRRELANIVHRTHAVMTDRNIKEGVTTNTQGERIEVTIVRCYSPATRDKMMEEYRSLPSRIDSTLEIVNATSDLITPPREPDMQKAKAEKESPKE